MDHTDSEWRAGQGDQGTGTERCSEFGERFRRLFDTGNGNANRRRERSSRDVATGNRQPLPENCIAVRGVRHHNLKDLDVDIPLNSLVVLTGVSGSGKSSLAFDVIYGESQRRYVEGLSPFARHFLEKLARPHFELVDGLPPAIAIEQKMLARNPRSTVGSLTEIGDLVRLLYSRVGRSRCTTCGGPVRQTTLTQLVRWLRQEVRHGPIRLLAAPASRSDRARCNETGADETEETEGSRQTRQARRDWREVAVIRGEGGHGSGSPSLREVVRAAFHNGNEVLTIQMEGEEAIYVSQTNVCARCGTASPELSAQHFSANSPPGMCPDCRGVGVDVDVDLDALIAEPGKSIWDGAISWWGNIRENGRSTWPLGRIDLIAEHYGVDIEQPWSALPEFFQKVILYGSDDEAMYLGPKADGRPIRGPSKGLVPEIRRLYFEAKTAAKREKYAIFMRESPCGSCSGSGLAPAPRAVQLGGFTIPDLGELPLSDLRNWTATLRQRLDDDRYAIAESCLDSIEDRLNLLHELGLSYLNLSRNAASLSGGEGQRIRLASQFANGLRGVLYVLDEPTIGLHPADVQGLLKAIRALQERGNSVLVVEHDPDVMAAADWIIDLGPGAGVHGGRLVVAGTPETVKREPGSLTGNYLARPCGGDGREGARRVPGKHWLRIAGASLHNLKDVAVDLPLGLLICVTGVSGSGKSSLINGVLRPALERRLSRSTSTPRGHVELGGAERVDRVVTVTQAPIGRTPRSCPATYVKAFDEIRKLFARTDDARRQKFNADRFSFNNRRGRCETCRGFGRIQVEMHFLPDVWVDCRDCEGTRYNEDTLSVRYRGNAISDVLEMSVEDACAFFDDQPSIAVSLRLLREVGLGYVKLGQSSTTLSGGEAQRIRLSRELARLNAGHILYILDEPTTGLHPADVEKLIGILHRLVEAGNTVVVIEHVRDLVRTADWVIDLGPGSGLDGGEIVAVGPPEVVSAEPRSATGRYLGL